MHFSFHFLHWDEIVFMLFFVFKFCNEICHCRARESKSQMCRKLKTQPEKVIKCFELWSFVGKIGDNWQSISMTLKKKIHVELSN